MIDQLEHQLNATYQLSISSGWEHAASYLRRQAVEAFLRDEETLAGILKEHAKYAETQQAAAREEHDKEEILGG